MKVNVLWDTGSSLSFITSNLAKRLHLKGTPIKLEIESIGGNIKSIDSFWYSVYLKDERGINVPIDVVDIEVISTYINHIKRSDIQKIFPWLNSKRLKCPEGAEIEILVGFQYAAYHPTRIDNSGHLLLLENRFGYAIAGEYCTSSHINKKYVKYATVLHSMHDINTFNLIENIGVTCQPECGGCRCGKCHVGGKEMSLKDEREYNLIESKITYLPEKGKWEAGYPYIKDPLSLQENRNSAFNMLKSTEKRLKKELSI